MCLRNDAYLSLLNLSISFLRYFKHPLIELNNGNIIKQNIDVQFRWHINKLVNIWVGVGGVNKFIT